MTESNDGKDHGRLALRAANRFLLSSIKILARTMNGDILRGVILLAIADANVRHLEPDSPTAQTYAGAGDAVPDDLRKPISIHALAQELSLPYETTRRHVNALIAAGACRRRETGVIVPATMVNPQMIAAVQNLNLENLRRLFRDLDAGGVELEG